MKNTFILGADIGGSHITTAIIDLKTSVILPGTLFRLPVDSHGTREEVLTVWYKALRAAVEAYQLTDICIGISIPGPFDYDNGISLIKDQDKYDALYGHNVKALLAEKFGMGENNIRLLNDAGAFLRGEIFAGAATGFKDVIGVTLGTGLGTSRCHHGLAEDANLWCSPFLDSIAEDYLSTRWFVKRYTELTGKKIIDVKALSKLVGKDRLSLQVFTEFGKNLGLFLAGFVQQEKPEAVILGGNISKASHLFLPETEKVLAQHNATVKIKIAKLGESAALMGAASCWHQEDPVIIQK